MREPTVGVRAPAWQAAGPKPCPAGRRPRPTEFSNVVRAAGRSAWGPSAPSAAAGPGAKPLCLGRAAPSGRSGVRGLPSPRAPCTARFPCEPLPPHLPTSRGSRPGLGQPRGAPTVQWQAEGLLKSGRSGRRSPGGAESERGLLARCHFSLCLPNRFSCLCPSC